MPDLSAQFPNQYLSNYWEIVNRNDPYYDSLISEKGLANMNGTGFKQYLRFKYKWQNLISSTGSFDEAVERMKETKIKYAERYKELQNGYYSSSWYELGPTFMNPGPDNGRLTTLALDPDNENIILAASGVGGLFYSMDGGNSFQNAGTDHITSPTSDIFLTNGVSSILINKHDEKKYWFIGTGDKNYNDSYSAGVYRSDDMGITWKQIGLQWPGLPPGPSYLFKIFKLIAIPGNPQIMLAATTRGIYRTTDAFGDNPQWQLVGPTGGKYYDIVNKPVSGGSGGNCILYASAEYKDPDYNYTGPGGLLPHPPLLISTDLGVTWQEVPQIFSFLPVGTYGGVRINLETTPADPEYFYIYISASSGITAYILKCNYTDHQISQFILAPTYSHYLDEGKQGFAISPINKYEMYLGCIDLFKLMNGSSSPSWELCQVEGMHYDIHEIIFNSEGSAVWVASDGGLSKNDDGYSSCNWTNQSNGIGVSTCVLMDQSKAHPEDYLIGCWDTGADYFRKDINFWGQTAGNDVWYGTFDLTEKGTYYVTDNGFGASRYTDYTNQSYITAPGNNFNFAIHIIPNSQVANSNKIYQTSFDYLHRSDNRGSTWEVCSPSNFNLDPAYTVWDAYTAPSTGDKVYARLIAGGLDDRLFMTENININPGSAVEWDELPLPVEWNSGNGFNSKTFVCITVDETDPNKFWIITAQNWNGSGPNPYDYKVFKYENNAYTNITKNLSEFNPSVRCIVHKEGTDDGVFIGTDVGIFYTDNSLDQWVDFNNGLPGTTVTNLRIDNTNNKLVASTFGRGVWETSLDCIYNPDETVQIDSTPPIWNTPRTIRGDILINAGATLTITSQVSLSLNSKVIVQPGGKLILDGGTLTSACNGLWQGIEVIGTKTQSQLYEQYQGIVEIINNGTISNARYGISLAQMDGQSYIPSTTGGILRCNQAKFINNKTSITFYPYRNFNPMNGREMSNRSYINKTLFSTTNEYPHLQDKPEAFVILDRVKTIQFKGCSFINSTISGSLSERGTGIHAFASAFTVNHICSNTSNPCNNYVRSRFEGLFYGIRAMGDGAAYYVNIDHSDFENNLRGVYIGGIDLISINRNSFKTRLGHQSLPVTGVYLDHCNGYSVQENSLEGHYQGITQSFDETGIIINNSGASPNEIYNNTFTKLQNGITAQDNNLGLVCKCNDYTGVKTDQSVLLSNSAPTSWGIAPAQGGSNSVTDAAGNTFSDRNSNTWDLYNEGALFDYYHHRPYNPKRVTPQFFSTTVLPRETTYNYENKLTSCPSKLGGGTQIEVLKDELIAKNDTINEKNIELQSLIDGGNTEETTETIVFGTPSEAIDIRNELLNKSPFLSDTVMQTAAANEVVLSNTLIHEILIANPQSAISETVLDKLDARSDPMPEDMYNEILSAEVTISALETKETELSGLKSERNQLSNSIVSYYLSDTLDNALDSLCNFLSDENTVQAKYLLANLLLQRNDSANMAETLEAIPVTFNLNTAELTLHNDYINYFNLMNHIQNDTLQGLSLDSTHSANAFALFELSNEPVKSYLCNLLLSAGAIEYSEPYLVADELKSSHTKKQHRMGPNRPIATLNVYPNPANLYFIIEYDLTNLQEAQLGNNLMELSSVQGILLGQIMLKDIKGSIILPTDDLKPGLYLITLRCGNHNIHSFKLSVLN